MGVVQASWPLMGIERLLWVIFQTAVIGGIFAVKKLIIKYWWDDDHRTKYYLKNSQAAKILMADLDNEFN